MPDNNVLEIDAAFAEGGITFAPWISQDRGFEGVDELAEALGVPAHFPGMGRGLLIEGKNGNLYSLTALLLKHIELMRRTLEVLNVSDDADEQR